MLYIAFVRNGEPCAVPYNPKLVAAVLNDMLRDERVSGYRTGFNTLEKAMQCARELAEANL